MGLPDYTSALIKTRYSVRTYLGVGTAVLLVPILIVSAWLATRAADAARAQIVLNAEQEVQGIAALIDHEIRNLRAVLIALASSRELTDNNLKDFYHRGVSVARQLGVIIVLADPASGRQVLNTETPWGSTRTGVVVTSAQLGRNSLDSEETFVTNVFFAPLLKKHVIAVAQPVGRDGDQYLLSVSIVTDKFAELIANIRLPDQSVIAIVDGDDQIVARSEKHDLFAGTKVKNPMPRPLPATSGVNVGVNREGISFHWFWQLSALTGWTIAIGVPEPTLDAPLRRAMFDYGLAGGLTFLFAMSLTYYFGGRLSQYAGTLGVDRQPSRREFEVLFDSAPNGVIVVDGNGLIVLANAQLARKFGYSREELVGQPVEILVPERFRDGHAHLRSGFKLDPLPKPMGADRALLGQRKDGSEFPVEITLNPLRALAGNLVMATVVDITARALAEQQIAAGLVERDDLRRRLMQAHENERLRLAHELHDKTGQSLAAVMLALKGIEPLIAEEGLGRVRSLRDQLDQMGRTLHRVAWELRPASIDELGLASALANYIAEWSDQFGIEVDFHCRGAALDSLSQEVRTTIYRVVQEALTNIAKHAPVATIASIVIDRSDTLLKLMIEDNGNGFETALQTRPTNEHLGIAGMRERVSLIGGNLEIDSSIGVGTTIFVRIPVEKERMPA